MCDALGPDAASVTFVSVSSAYTRPARTLAAYHAVYAEQLRKTPPYGRSPTSRSVPIPPNGTSGWGTRRSRRRRRGRDERMGHGGGVQEVRVGRTAGRFTCEIDPGSGFDNPVAGYLAPRSGIGAGLWIARQLTWHIEFFRSPEGFTARILLNRTLHGQVDRRYRHANHASALVEGDPLPLAAVRSRHCPARVEGGTR